MEHRLIPEESEYLTKKVKKECDRIVKAKQSPSKWKNKQLEEKVSIMKEGGPHDE